jgi:Na+-driven multidrug efflux pump
MGLEVASCTVVGQEIGKGNVREAKHYYKLVSIVTALILCATSILIYSLKEQIVRVFTNNEEIIQITSGIVYLISFNTFPDGYKAMLKGVVKALGI